MKINNVDVEKLAGFVSEVKADPVKGKKSKRVEGEWEINEGKPQFRARVEFASGSATLEADQAPFMGGGGLSPDPIQYCLFGMAACYAGTFVTLATEAGVRLESLKVIAENKVDLTKTLGLSENPIVEEVTLTLRVKANAPREELEKLQQQAVEKCPGVYCLTHPIALNSRLDLE